MKKCKQGYYYCHTDKKCKRIPSGYRVGLGGYLRKENGEEQGENDNADNTNGNGNGNGNSNGGSNGGGVSESIISEKRDGKSAKDKGYSLRDWFKGGGWKQTGGKYDGKPCAKQPGQTTKPYCRDADDRAAMSKDERNKAAAKKRKEDPNPNRKGKAKMVTQNNSFEPKANIVEEEKKKKMKEEQGLDENRFASHGGRDTDAGSAYAKPSKGGDKKGVYTLKGKDGKPLFDKREKSNESTEIGEKFNTQYKDKKKLGQSSERKSLGRGSSIKDGSKPSGYESKKEFRDQSMKLRKHRERFGDLAKEEVQVTEGKDKKGKGSGTKDACYHKVKSRYSVWPSAYASGALVKCRKVGAANWGNKSEGVNYGPESTKKPRKFADFLTTAEKNARKTQKEIKDKVFNKEEWIVDNAAQYFFNEGINEEGLAIFIEELGVENFVEFVHDLAEDSELIEAYALTGKKKTPKRLPKGTQPAKTTKATIARGDRTIKAASPSGAFKKRPAASKAVETAKEKQPEKKPVKSTLVKGVADTLARGALSAWQGHKAAMKKKKEGKSVASQVGAGLATAAGAMLKKGKKHLSDDYQYSDWRDDFKAMEYEFIDLIKPEPLVSEGAMPDPINPKKHRDASRQSKINNMKRSDNPNEREVANKKLTPAAKVDTPLTLANKTIGFSKNTAPKEKPRGPKLVGEGKYSSSVRATYGGKTETFPVEVYKKKSKKVKEEVETIDESGKKCWKGYKKAGTQKLFGKTYNRCVKANEEIEVQEATSRPKATQRGKLSKADAQKRQARLDRIAAAKERSGEVKPKTGETPTPKKEKKEKIDPRLERAGNQVLRSIRNEAKDETEEGITGGPIRKKKRSPKKQHDFEKERRSERKKRGEFEKVGDNFSRHRMTGSRGHGTGGDNPRISYIHNNQYEMESDWRSDLGEDWQKVNKSDKTDGMSQKAVNAYRRENPGSKLKTAVTGNPKPGSKDAKRRSAYCSRSEGQKKMHNIDCTKTPDKAICKARRRWKC